MERKSRPLFPLLTFFSWLSLIAGAATAKSTIEPCSGTDSCPALLGYTLYADLKVSEVAALFQTDSLSLLAANAIDFSVPDVENRILPAGLFLRVPATCSCSGGIRRSLSTRYTVRPSDTLASIAASVYAGLTSSDQIQEVNNIRDPSAVDVGLTLVVPLPCTCFNSTDNFLPAVYLSYVVAQGDSLPAIAARYSTTVTDIMNVNAMGSPSILPGDILAIPLPVAVIYGYAESKKGLGILSRLGDHSSSCIYNHLDDLEQTYLTPYQQEHQSSACPSMFPTFASDYGLIVANGTYAITAGRCVQCSCGPGNLNLYCSPSSLAVSCSSMQCSNSNLVIGNITSQQTSAGCSVTSCNYGGFINGFIVTSLTTSLQPQCPGQHQFPSVIPPPSTVRQDSYLTPSPSPAQAGGTAANPRPSVPAGAHTAFGPAGSTSEAASPSALGHILCMFTLPLVLSNFYFR